MSNIVEKIYSIKKIEDNKKIYKVISLLGIRFKFRLNKPKDFPYKKTEPRIACYKYVHIMNNGIHSVNIIQFLNKYFNNNEHCFLFPCVMFDKTKEKLKDVKNVFHAPIKNIHLKTTKKIIIHGLFDENLIKQLYKYKKYLSKCYWFIWGGDLYSAIDDKKNNFVRKNMAGILTTFDEEIYRDKYGDANSYFDVTYPHEKSIETYQKVNNSNCTHIQINNSADSTTLEMLDILSKFKDQNLKVSTVLSYTTVGDKINPLEIMKKGYEIFGNKFNPLIEFMPKEEYAKHIASVNIYISNQNRQQGNGNASIICALGNKVFTKSNTTVYKKYNSIGIKYYDTYSIPNLSWEEFCYMEPEVTKTSIDNLKNRMRHETKVKQWKEFFNA